MRERYSDALVQKTSELAKALSAASSSGQALIPEDLEPALVEELLALQPLLRLVPIIQGTGRVHEITRRTAHGQAYAEGAGVAGTGGQGTYDRPTVTLKIHHYWGEVEGFQRAASAKFIDSLLAEQGAGLEAMADLLEFEILWANATADPYLTDGFDPLITTQIKDIDGVITLANLDTIIDECTAFRGVSNDPYLFLMSKKMVSKITGLMTYARRAVQTIEFEGGFRMESYRGYPMLETACVAPPSTSPAVTATKGAGGSLADDEYFYQIASVRPRGESLAGTVDSDTTETTNNKVVLTWTGDDNALLYKIYRGLTTGPDNLTLLATIAAKARDGDGKYGANIETWTDDGTTTPPTGAANEKPMATGEENIFFLNLNEARGAGWVSLLNQMGEKVDNLINYIPLATTKESYNFLLSCFGTLQVPWEKLHGHLRRVKMA